MREQLVKIWNKRKTHVSDFSALSIDNMKTKEKQIYFLRIKTLNNTKIFRQQG